jgi:hypothetical protein
MNKMPISNITNLMILKSNGVNTGGEGNSVIIVAKLLAEWPRNWDLSLVTGRGFSFLHSIQTGYKAHQASYPVGTWSLSLQV